MVHVGRFEEARPVLQKSSGQPSVGSVEVMMRAAVS